MKLSQFFDRKLYFQGIKKIRISGILAAVLIIVLNATLPVIYATSAIIDGEFFSGSVQTHTVSGIMFMPFTLLLLGFAPFFVLRMFSYLSSRSESDFYHSIPQSRPCVYLSFMAAVMTWVLGILLGTVFVNSLFWLFCPGTLLIFSDIALQTLFYLLTALILTGFAAIAVSVTGTGSSSFVVFVLFTLFFRVISAMFLGILDTVCPVLNTESGLFAFFSPQYFLPFSFPLVLLEGIRQSDVYGNLWVYLYSLLLIAVLWVLGGLAYVKRKSESATRSAPSRKLQALYRCMITMPLCMGLLWVFMTFFFAAERYNYMDTSYITVAIGLLITAALVYFLYELIFTRSLKEVGRAALQLPILLGACVLVGATVLTVRYAVYSTLPSTDDIASISLRYGSSLVNYGGQTYEEALLASVSTDDTEAKSLVADTLQSTVKRDSSHRSDYASRNTVSIHLKNGRTLVRNLSNETFFIDRLTAIIGSSEEYRSRYLSLPSPGEIKDYNCSVANFYFVDLEPQKVWQMFCEEYNALSDEDKLTYKATYVRGSASYFDIAEEDGEVLVEIRLSGSKDGINFSSSYPVPASFVSVHEYIAKEINTDKLGATNTDNLTAMRQLLAELKDAHGEIVPSSSEAFDLWAGGVVYDPVGQTVCQLEEFRPEWEYDKKDNCNTETFYAPLRMIASDPAVQNDPSFSGYILFLSAQIPEESGEEDGVVYTTYTRYTAALSISEETARELINNHAAFPPDGEETAPA